MKIVSWNIAGGRKIKSLDLFDYGQEDLAYFAGQLSRVKADAICLQETHINYKKSVAQEFASRLEMPFVFEIPMHGSHIDSRYQIGIAIISKSPFDYKKSLCLPYPHFRLFWQDGREANKHNKYLQVVKTQDIYIANTQLLPIQMWGYDYHKGEGLKLSSRAERIFMKLKMPLIFCGDFNFGAPSTIYSSFFKTFGLRDALPPDRITRPTPKDNKGTPDHILYSPEFLPMQSKIIKTQTDHYLCFANLKLRR